MSSHVLVLSSWLFASPLNEGERIEVRGSTLILTSLNPHPTLSALHPGRDPRGGEYLLTA
jgi:hypothetical protein